MAQLEINTTIGGKSISGSLVRTGASEIGFGTEDGVPLDAGNAGTLTTRTDNNTGVVTLTSGHDIVTSGALVDVYWDGGSRRGMTATVATNAVTIDGGAGTNLPTLSTVVVVDAQEILDVDATATAIVFAAVATQRRSLVCFLKDDDTEIKVIDIGLSGVDGEGWTWASDVDVATPFSDDVGQVTISNGSADGSCIVSGGLVLDNLS